MTLLHIARPETVELFNTFLWGNDADKDDPDQMMDQLEKYCNPRKNTTYERHIFNKGNQNPATNLCGKISFKQRENSKIPVFN